MKKEKLKHIAKRITAFAAAAAMAATFTFPTEVGDGFFDGFGNAIVASAETYTAEYNISAGSVTIDSDGTYRIYSNDPNTSVTNTITVAAGVSANITLDNVNIDVSGTSDVCAFKIADNSTGNVTIDLVGENTLKSGAYCAGLQKNAINTATLGKLTIKSTNGTGKLTATGGDYGAGIGGGLNRSGSDITISGGTVTATGGGQAAGIGGGSGGSGSSITISGGTVTATGKVNSSNRDGGAGIGGGYHGDGSYIKITGGNVTATGGVTDVSAGRSGAGIGGGSHGDGSYIEIIDGTVIATGGSEGAGIGGGMGDLGRKGNGSHITISGGNVTATGGNDGAGIGAGNNGNCSDIIISGGTVTAAGGVCGAGIGGGSAHLYDNGGNCSGITISGGTVTATGGAKSAGIGGGYNGDGSNITISGGNVTAIGGKYGAGIGGGHRYLIETLKGQGSNITISGGSVYAKGSKGYYDFKGADIGCGVTCDSNSGTASDAIYTDGVPVTPTDGTNNVYLREIDNPDGADIKINSVDYPKAHTYYDTSSSAFVTEKKIYAYLPAKTLASPNNVLVGATAKDCYYDEASIKWINVAYVPAEDTTTYSYTGSEQTYGIPEHDYYTLTNNKQTDAGDYTVTVALTDTTNTVWSNGTTTNQTYTFTINKKLATVTPPTAPTAISYGETLAETDLTEGWIWEKGSTYMPDVIDNTFSVYMLVDDDNNYDYNNISGISYSTTEHKLSCDVTITVNPATPTITVTATPSSAITGKETTVTVTAEVKNPNNNTLNDLRAPEISYKIGNDPEQAITNGSFVIPADTPNGTTFTISARTPATANYSAGTGTTTILVSDCTHPDVSDAWETDDTYHWHACSVCGDKTDITAHSYGNWKITVPATTQANGKKERVCSVCGYVQEGVVTYGGDESTGNMENATDPDTNALHADLELTDEDIISKIPLTAEELEAIENGADLEVYMVVIDYSGNVPSADKALAESVLTGDMQIGMYIDVSLFVKVGDNDPRAVTETNGDLKITFEMPEKLINTDNDVTREYSIIRVHDGKTSVLECAYDSYTRKGLFSTDQFSTYAIAYTDTSLEAPVTKYPVNNMTNGIVKTDKTSAAAGERVTVSVIPGYNAHIFGKNGNEIARISGTGSFIMPEGGVKITVEYPINLALTWGNSYIYSYDSDMNYITVNKTRKQGTITVDLGKEYAGKSFVIYEGKKSTSVKVTEGVLDANGKFTIEVEDGKNYTLVVE